MKVMLTLRLILFLILGYLPFHTVLARPISVPIGTISISNNSEVEVRLVKRFQRNNINTKDTSDCYDQYINSPKSVRILNNKHKFYVNSLEGCSTSVYSQDDFKLLKVIRHEFDSKNQYLFDQDYKVDCFFSTKVGQLNYFNGKPVESCLSHNGKYLWIPYYRRSYDHNATDPSAVCIVDTDTDTIVRVITVAPLPKMITCSPDNKIIAITHWGDSTVTLIDISSFKPKEFRFIDNIVIDHKLLLKYNKNETIDRDHNCGNCLRGTVFTPDSKYIFVGKMGSDGIAIIDVRSRKYIATVTGMKQNVRHLLIRNSILYLSINKTGFVQKTSLNEFISHFLCKSKNEPYTKWKNAYVGLGARTISITPDGKYLFVAVNNESKVVVVRTEDMKVIAKCETDSYPVGLDVSEDGKWIIVTSQGRGGEGGNSVMVYKVNYKKS
jgi:DNA-binding beta-propeller fold protein YncE